MHESWYPTVWRVREKVPFLTLIHLYIYSIKLLNLKFSISTHNLNWTGSIGDLNCRSNNSNSFNIYPWKKNRLGMNIFPLYNITTCLSGAIASPNSLLWQTYVIFKVIDFDKKRSKAGCAIMWTPLGYILPCWRYDFSCFVTCLGKQ